MEYMRTMLKQVAASLARLDARYNLLHGWVQTFVAIDQLLNVLTNPFSKQTWADETLSSRCGRLGHRYPYKFWKRVIDALFFWQGPNHCVRAFEKEKTRYQSPPEARDPVPTTKLIPPRESNNESFKHE